MALIRLDKYLADMGKGTRSEVKEQIRAGKVRVDGDICRLPERKLDPAAATVTLGDEAVGYMEHEYFMLNKPKGCVSATQDSRYPTVMDCIREHRRKDLFPVGRLDLDTEGLLLITNDGALAHALTSPARHIPKVYEACIAGIATWDDVEAFAAGIDIGEKRPALPAKLEIVKANVISQVRVTVYEGKFHQVKRMFEVLDKPVLQLKRVAMGPLTLDEGLAPGEYRALTEAELAGLKGAGEKQA